jgi:hypothetical protein
MINLSWKTSKPPTKKRKRKGNEQAKKTLARKRYLKSIRYCQKCGKGVYPNSEGQYPLYEVEDDVRGRLVVCKECYGKI